MKPPIFARQKEIKVLSQLFQSGKPEFLAVYGRRRVGKTFLIREFFRNQGLYFALTGVKGASIKKQLKNFSGEFTRVFGKEQKPPASWFDAFTHLRQAIEKVKSPDRIILFFDELPWLAGPRSDFLQDLDHFWNRYMSEDPRVIVVVCGSAASWMIKKVIRDKGGLHGRLTAEMRLLPFTLQETEEFLKYRDITLTRKAIIDIYMAIGGIPKYLNYVEKGKSALQTISYLCFEGPLVDEFDELYASLFEKHTRHVNIVKVLAEHPYGLTKSVLAKKTKMTPGGGMNSILDELEQSGFILLIKDFEKQKKESSFRLIDEYSLFYLKWAAKAKENKEDKFWMSVFNSSLGSAWAGYAFEMLCLKHLSKIKGALGISGILTNASGWIYKPPKCSKQKSAQIDLLIDRADNCINLCEIKYCNEEFVINKSYDQQLREKKPSSYPTQTQKKRLHYSDYALWSEKNAGHFETADVTLTMEDLF